MHAPEKSRRQAERQRGGTESPAPRRQKQRATHNAEQEQTGEEVKGEVQRVIAADIRAAEGVVQRQGEIEQWSAGDRVVTVGQRGPIGQRCRIDRLFVMYPSSSRMNGMERLFWYAAAAVRAIAAHATRIARRYNPAQP